MTASDISPDLGWDMVSRIGRQQRVSLKDGVSLFLCNSSQLFSSSSDCPSFQKRKSSPSYQKWSRFKCFVAPRPRWLLEQGRPLDAQKSLQYLRGCDGNIDAVSDELNEIKENVELHNTIDEAPWHVLFTDRNLFARLWRGAVLQFMAQMCGATAIKYYLPTVFLALGLSKDLSLMAGGIESTLKIGCSIIEMLIIDKLGRRRTLLLGSAIMSLSMLVRSTDQSEESRLKDSVLKVTDQWSIATGIPRQCQ